MLKPPAKKISCYVDETGQDTLGAIFLVATVFIQTNHEQLRVLLQTAEQNSGKGKKKWTKATLAQRKAYIEQIMQEDAFIGKIFFRRYYHTTDFLTCVCETIARATAVIAAHQPLQVTVFIDGLRRPERHRTGTLLRRLQVTVHKIRGLRDESDEFIRLADAVAGFVRDHFEGDVELRSIYQKAVARGVIKEA